jgi:hypothetical protein
MNADTNDGELFLIKTFRLELQVNSHRKALVQVILDNGEQDNDKYHLLGTATI